VENTSDQGAKEGQVKYGLRSFDASELRRSFWLGLCFLPNAFDLFLSDLSLLYFVLAHRLNPKAEDKR